MSGTLNQVIQILGALAILAGFGLSQARILGQESLPYLLLNLIGGILLLFAAYSEEQFGFIILEIAWVLISLRGIYSQFIKSAA